MSIKIEGGHSAAAILSEDASGLSRDNVTIAASQSILPCELLARQSVSDGGTLNVVTPDETTGDGILTLESPATNSKAKDGRYTVLFTEAVANGGKFQVEGPDGKTIGEGVVGTIFNKEIKFTIADGATDFAEGDVIHIDVDFDEVSGEEYVAWDPNATDGTEKPVAMSIYMVTTGVGETQPVAAITRLSQLNKHCIAWPDGVTEAQKSAAADALAQSHIVLR
jgi:hypothetical protein